LVKESRFVSFRKSIGKITPPLSLLGMPLILKARYQGQVQDVEVPTDKGSEYAYKALGGHFHVPVSRLRVIKRGQLISAALFLEHVKDQDAVQVLGKASEDESGLDAKDIDLILQQMGGERDAVVRALRQEGNVIDAMVYLGSH
jgi:NACalpha-BTF3-like transcription factor